MSCSWMRLHNTMKVRARADMLTKVQIRAYDRILDLLRFPHLVNLCGPTGSGKTYLAWALTDIVEGCHVSVPETLDNLEVIPQVLLIDNAPYRELTVRRLMALANLKGAQSVVFITRAPIHLPMSRVELAKPSAEDISLVRTNFERHGFLYSNHHQLPESPNYWQLMLAYS